MSLPPLTDLIFQVRRVATKAGYAIMHLYDAYDPANPGAWTADAKADGSPVTLADAKAEQIILPALAVLTPDIPVISEEAAAAGESPDFGDGPFWLVDPLDGTKEYLSRNGEFTVNIALVIDGAPVLGVVFAPALGRLYAGCGAPGPGAAVQWTAVEGTHDIAVRQPPAAGLTVVGSRSHGEADKTAAFLSRFTVAETISCGSSLKFCQIAAGQADLYPRFGPTCLWDTAAGHAVLNAAGARVETADGQPLTYGPRPKFLNPEFIAYGKC